MKIGIDARLAYYRPGGIVEYTRHVIQELAALDQTNEYRVIQHYRHIETLSPTFRRLNTHTPSHHRMEPWSLSIELAPYRLDLLHSPDFIPPQHGAHRQIITVHDLHFLHYPQFMTAGSRRYYNDQIAWAVQRADHILVDSCATQNDLANLLQVPIEKTTVHMLGVSPAFRPLPDDERRSLRQQLDLPEAYILFVGTFEPRKNIPGLLDAYALLRQDFPDTPPLILAGRRGWLYNEIFSKVRDLGFQDHVIWREAPSPDDLLAIYNCASMLILPSHYEGFGLPILEAMACGIPTIAANRSSLPEVTGDAGLLVNPDDPAEIAHAMQRVLTDEVLRAQLCTSGIARAATFTWRKTAEIVLRTYHES